MAFLFGGKSSVAPPRKDNADIAAEASRERRRRALAVGRGSTILGGLDEQEQPQVQRAQLGTKTLLGQ